MVSKNIRTIIFIVVIVSLLLIGILCVYFIIKKRSIEGFMQTKFDQESDISNQLTTNPFYLVYVDNTNKFKFKHNKFKQIYIQTNANENTISYSIDNKNTFKEIYNIELTKEANNEYRLIINKEGNTTVFSHLLRYRDDNLVPRKLGISNTLAIAITNIINNLKNIISTSPPTTSTSPPTTSTSPPNINLTKDVILNSLLTNNN